MNPNSLFWQAILVLLVAVVALFFIGIVGDLIASWWRHDLLPWWDRKQKAKQVTDEAMRAVERRRLDAVAHWRRR